MTLVALSAGDINWICNSVRTVYRPQKIWLGGINAFNPVMHLKHFFVNLVLFFCCFLEMCLLFFPIDLTFALSCGLVSFNHQNHCMVGCRRWKYLVSVVKRPGICKNNNSDTFLLFLKRMILQPFTAVYVNNKTKSHQKNNNALKL